MTVDEYNELYKRMKAFEELDQKIDNFNKYLRRINSDRFEKVQITISTSPDTIWNVYLEPFMIEDFKKFLIDQCAKLNAQLVDI